MNEAATPAVAATRVNLFDLDRAGLQQFFVGIGEKKYRAEQVMKWLYHQQVDRFDAMTDVGRALRTRLQECAELVLPKVMHEQQSADGTTKWVLALAGGNAIEMVYIPETGRGTLCVSSQVGCSLNCSFCSTAKQGFNRNLATSEIIGQVWIANQRLKALGRGERPLTNVVMMGMGEPLLNFENVVAAMDLMRDDFAFGLANKRVTLSTAGLVPMIDALSARSDVSLAVSLHAPNDALRDQLVPLNRKYPIAELLAACNRYVAKRPRAAITFEYTLMKGVNDHPEHARALVKLLRRVPSKLNLIPFNPFPGADYERSDAETIEAFKRIVMEAGLIATVRRTRGDDIDAACGQLVGQVLDRTRRSREHRARLEERSDAA
ncbi:MAG: 23S rRNA (adenine(2503)-C(2))-methyltransferase RlmN [Xanthomonadales bacterium]|nr:23S rRNA (adenine(2503)-C(2))-methyltransferase RlmN [Xanthomonadales bacterium]